MLVEYEMSQTDHKLEDKTNDWGATMKNQLVKDLIWTMKPIYDTDHNTKWIEKSPIVWLFAVSLVKLCNTVIMKS